MKTNYSKTFLALGTAAFLAISFNINAKSARTYELRGEPQTGTRIKTVEATSPISFNKRFAELPADEQALFKAKYDEMGTLDTPPFPNSGLKRIYAPIIKANKRIQATGSLHLMAKVNANGFVESVEVVSSPDVKLAAAAERTLLATKFDPATCNGVACEMSFPLEIVFE